MAKWFGKIGFVETKKTGPGVWMEESTEREYYGDFNRITRRLQSSGGVNDNFVISNELSIIADAFAKNNFRFIRYCEFMGVKWKITNVEVNRPKLILTLGEEYNGQQTKSAN